MLVRRGVGRIGRPGLIGTMARTAVVAGTATAVVGGVRGHQQKKTAQAQQAEAYQQEEAAAAQQQTNQQASGDAGAGRANDNMAELEKLAELHGKGVLDDQEFAAAKAKLLGI